MSSDGRGGEYEHGRDRVEVREREEHGDGILQQPHWHAIGAPARHCFPKSKLGGDLNDPIYECLTFSMVRERQCNVCSGPVVHGIGIQEPLAHMLPYTTAISFESVKGPEM